MGVAYAGATRVEAVRRVNLELLPGTITGLAGPNGAGKTSVMEVCVGALRQSAGVATWFGNDLLSGAAKRRIGFCPDAPAFPPGLTAYETARFFASLDGLSGAASTGRINYLAEKLKLEGSLRKRVSELSRGTLQRLGVLQALVHERDLLICDESFAPLDPFSQVDLRELLLEEALRGAAVLVSSHQLDQLAKLANSIVVMAEGEFVRTLDPLSESSIEATFFESIASHISKTRTQTG